MTSESLPTLFLVGYRGSGKTAVGQILARKLGRELCDTDALLEDRLGVSIGRFFSEHGEAAFRVEESGVLRTVVDRTRGGERLVVATGGGIVLSPANVELMEGSGTILWLEASVETLKARIGADPNSREARPALEGASSVDEVELVLAKREPLYRSAAGIRVGTECLGAEEVAEKVLAVLRQS